MEIFISSDSNQDYFIKNAMEEIENTKETAKKLNIEMKPVYPPWNVGRRPANIVERINQIKDASIVLMNITPIETIKIGEKMSYVLNPGVCIEFGILIGINRTDKCRLFCLGKFERGLLSPIFHNQNIDSFDLDKIELLKKLVGEYICEYLHDSTEYYEKYVTNTSGTIPTH